MTNRKNIAECNFGQLLSHLLTVSHQKSYVLASFLNYDVSYISKWVTGTMLPAAKHANTMCEKIAAFIGDNVEETALKELHDIYGTKSREELKVAIYESLKNAYQLSGEKKGKSKSLLVSGENNSKTIVNPHLQKMYVKDLPRSSSEGVDKFNLALMVDLFALGKEDKIRIAKADDGTNFMENVNEVHYLLSLSKDIVDDSFDALLLTYMQNNYVDSNFIVSHYNRMPCSLLYAVQNYCMHMTVVSQNHRAILADSCTDVAVANEMYDTIISLEQSFAKPLIHYTTMQELIREKHYFNFILSSNIRLYLTRVDELFLPDDLFEEFLGMIDSEENDISQIRSLHTRFQATLKFANVKIAILDSCLKDYAINGSLDFYGNTIETTVEQRERHLKFLSELLNRTESDFRMQLIMPERLKDFEKGFAPCIYFSDSFAYVRVRTGAAENKVSVMDAVELKEVYHRFFRVIFGQEASALIDISPYLNIIRMLKN